jgi:hypothetical protein
MKSIKSLFTSYLSISLLIGFCMSTLVGCSSGSNSSTVSGAQQPTGTLAFGLSWEKNGKVAAKVLAAAADVCSDYGIDTVVATLYDPAGNKVATQSWPCSAHGGTLADVPKGENYKLVIEGSAANTVVWKSEKTGVAVVAGQSSDIGTLVMAYIGGDTAKPTVTDKSPAAAATLVPVTSSITVTFSEQIAPSTLTSATCSVISSGSSTVNGTLTYDATKKTATFKPTSNLAYSTTYIVTVTTGVTDMAALPLEKLVTWSFTTEEPPPTPPDAPLTVPANLYGPGQIILNWATTARATSYNIYWSNSSGVTPSNGTKIANVTSPYTHKGLDPALTYYYVVTAENAQGESPASSQITATPLTTPTVVASTPTTGSVNVSLSSPGITATFSEAMEPTSINATTFTLAVTGGANVPGTVSYDAVNKKATFVSATTLNAWTDYTATITTGARSLKDVAMAATKSWSFKSAQIAGTWVPTSLASAPTARYNHTAIWTGTEMIVSEAGSDSGVRYNPVTDSWIPLESKGTLQIGPVHSTVWTGKVMIVWGGTAGAGIDFNTGGRYDPATRSWSATSTVGAPSGRTGHSAIWTGSRMIIWGGMHGGPMPTNYGNGAIYEPDGDTWSPISSVNAPTARSGHSAIFTGTQMIIWGGGSDDAAYNRTYYNTGAIYNPTNDTWTTMSNINAPAVRSGYSMISTGSKLIVWGGKTATSLATDGGAIYDPVPGSPTYDTWITIPDTGSTSGRRYHKAVWNGSLMYIYGGYDKNSLLATELITYNPATGSLASLTGPFTKGRSGHSAIWDGTRLIVWGGQETSAVNTGAMYLP